MLSSADDNTYKQLIKLFNNLANDTFEKHKEKVSVDIYNQEIVQAHPEVALYNFVQTLKPLDVDPSIASTIKKLQETNNNTTLALRLQQEFTSYKDIMISMCYTSFFAPQETITPGFIN